MTGDDLAEAEAEAEAAACCWWCICSIDSMLNFLAALVSASSRREAAVLWPRCSTVPLVVVVRGRLVGGEEAADGKAIEVIPAGNRSLGAGILGG